MGNFNCASKGPSNRKRLDDRLAQMTTLQKEHGEQLAGVADRVSGYQRGVDGQLEGFDRRLTEQDDRFTCFSSELAEQKGELKSFQASQHQANERMWNALVSSQQHGQDQLNTQMTNMQSHLTERIAEIHLGQHRRDENLKLFEQETRAEFSNVGHVLQDHERQRQADNTEVKNDIDAVQRNVDTGMSQINQRLGDTVLGLRSDIHTQGQQFMHATERLFVQAVDANKEAVSEVEAQEQRMKKMDKKIDTTADSAMRHAEETAARSEARTNEQLTQMRGQMSHAEETKKKELEDLNRVMEELKGDIDAQQQRQDKGERGIEKHKRDLKLAKKTFARRLEEQERKRGQDASDIKERLDQETEERKAAIVQQGDETKQMSMSQEERMRERQEKAEKEQLKKHREQEDATKLLSDQVAKMGEDTGASFRAVQQRIGDNEEQARQTEQRNQQQREDNEKKLSQQETALAAEVLIREKLAMDVETRVNTLRSEARSERENIERSLSETASTMNTRLDQETEDRKLASAEQKTLMEQMLQEKGRTVQEQLNGVASNVTAVKRKIERQSDRVLKMSEDQHRRMQAMEDRQVKEAQRVTDLDETGQRTEADMNRHFEQAEITLQDLEEAGERMEVQVRQNRQLQLAEAKEGDRKFEAFKTGMRADMESSETAMNGRFDGLNEKVSQQREDMRKTAAKAHRANIETRREVRRVETELRDGQLQEMREQNRQMQRNSEMISRMFQHQDGDGMQLVPISDHEVPAHAPPGGESGGTHDPSTP